MFKVFNANFPFKTFKANFLGPIAVKGYEVISPSKYKTFQLLLIADKCALFNIFFHSTLRKF